MIAAKQVADLITLSRAAVSIVLVGIGEIWGAAALPVAGMLLLYSWVSDVIDGPIARRSKTYYHSWLGDHDPLFLGLAEKLALGNHHFSREHGLRSQDVTIFVGVAQKSDAFGELIGR